ncbi:MAG: arginine--tRNA ligase [Desulfobacterales bacterium]|nr:arginine--tRNA ligase [Desulfobacterales bacterium]
MNGQKLMDEILARIGEAVEEVFGERPENLSLGFPPGVLMGDFAFECFPLAKTLRRSPKEIAEKVAERITPGGVIEEASARGPYINVKTPNKTLFGDICDGLIQAPDDFCKITAGRDRRVMVEYLSPNTNKPLHLGHLRNGALGMAVSNLLEAAGWRVVKGILVNDRGVHICKSMLAWDRWGEGATPGAAGKKGDHFVGDWYVRYAQEADKDPGLEDEIQEMLQQWEAGDPETVKLWKMMNEWVYDGFSATYRTFGLEFDVYYYESDTYKLGKDIIARGLETGVFKKAPRVDGDGDNIVFHLPEDKFGVEKNGQPKKVLVLRHDGTSVYITQDIGTSLVKVEEHDLDRSIYVVGSEQVHHFQCLFEMLGALGYEWAAGCHHLSYGMVYLPEGKMKSREGKIVDADDLIKEVVELSKEQIRLRNEDNPLSEEEVERRAAIIGVGAIKFYLLRVRATQDIHFDPRESISFDGCTGPYCQYAYARISGILRKAADKGFSHEGCDYSLLGEEEELQLVQKLIQLPAEVEAAANDLSPSRLATHIFNTAKVFNQFYNKHKVLHAETRELVEARLALARATASALKRGLGILGIDVLEKM